MRGGRRRRRWMSSGDKSKYKKNKTRAVRCHFHLEVPVCQCSLVLSRPHHTSRTRAKQTTHVLVETQNTAGPCVFFSDMLFRFCSAEVVNVCMEDGERADSA